MKWSRGMAAVACGACALFAGCGESGAPDPEKVKGEEVTQEEWISAFDFSNRTNFSAQIVTETDGEPTKSVIKFDGDKIHIMREYIDNSAEGTEPKKEKKEFYQEKSGDTYFMYIYNEEDKTWEKSETDHPYTTEDLNADLISEFVLDSFHSDFLYDSSAKAYVRDIKLGDNMRVCKSVKISRGKLSVVKEIIIGSDYSETVTMSFYNYGSTKVTLPKIKEEGGNGSSTNPDTPFTVSDSAWVAALSKRAFTNVTMESSAMGMVGTIKIANGKIYRGGLFIVRDNNGNTTSRYFEHYYEIVNGVTYVYKQVGNGTWTKEPAPEENDILASLLADITIFKNSKSGFTYDEAKQAYTASTITINVMGEETTFTDVTLQFRDGKLTSLTATMGSTVTFTYSDYGTTVVNLPVVAAE